MYILWGVCLDELEHNSQINAPLNENEKKPNSRMLCFFFNPVFCLRSFLIGSGQLAGPRICILR